MKNRFTWEQSDLRKISEAEINDKGAVLYKDVEIHPLCDKCKENRYCQQNCKEYQLLASEIADDIFEKHFAEDTMDANQVELIMDNLIVEINQILQNRVALTKALYICIKIHLVEAIREELNINISLR